MGAGLFLVFERSFLRALKESHRDDGILDQVGIWHGLVMGGGAGLTVVGQFRVATEKTVSGKFSFGFKIHLLRPFSGSEKLVCLVSFSSLSTGGVKSQALGYKLVRP